MNELVTFSVPNKELSCLVGNLFAEIEPPCEAPHGPDDLSFCGRTRSGKDAMLLVSKDYCIFTGDPDDLKAARDRPCIDRRCSYGG